MEKAIKELKEAMRNEVAVRRYEVIVDVNYTHPNWELMRKVMRSR